MASTTKSKKLGITAAAYARYRGVSQVAVHKAIKTGRITTLPDGSIDPDEADRQWEENSLPRKDSGKRTEDYDDIVLPDGQSGGTSLLQARTVNEVLKVKLNKLELARRKNELVERDKAIAHVFNLARAERDAWLNWPSRVSSQLAAKLGADAHAMHVALETAVREHLQELSEIKASVS